MHVVCWIAQFIGHGFAEGRSPALLDNLIGGRTCPTNQKRYSDDRVLAIVLAPFFVHLEVLFKLGYKPAMFRQLQNDVGVEIARFRKIEAEKKRTAERRTQ